MTTRIRFLLTTLAIAGAVAIGGAQTRPAGQAAFEAETLQHFQALLRIDTQQPPGERDPRPSIT